MMTKNPATQYAPARLSDQTTIEAQKRLLAECCDQLKQLSEAVSEMILIVNKDRQIVFFNSIFPSLLGVDDPERLYGLRPGEALGCVHARRNPGCCGTSEFCAQCGAVNAILAALSNKADLRECRLLKNDSLEALDLLVRTTPLQIREELFSIVAITDISHEKRRRVLERIFFHDTLNTAASIKVFAKILNDDPGGGNAAIYRQKLLAGIHQLSDELYFQKELLDAENNELVIQKQKVDSYLLVRDVVEMYRNRFPKHRIVVHGPAQKIILHTDSGLLHRVLGNMLLNALEASRPEQPVTVSVKRRQADAEFRVHNESHMPEESRLQLFQRSFSTKGSGRGLGTYSIKLLTERYLNGSISAHTSFENGTTFVASYPL